MSLEKYNFDFKDIPDEIWTNHIFLYTDDFLNLYLTNSLFRRLLKPYITKNKSVKKSLIEGDSLNIFF